ncbi:MAG: hypothetical protein WCS98_06350 [Bacillota bacterium]|nr:hypothetical protein [Bacillota bacterium]
MNWKVWVLLLILVPACQGCSLHSEEKTYKAIHQKLTGLETYSCIAQIYVKGNKEPGQFKTKQWFCMPDKYRLEVLEPQAMQGKTTVYDGSRLWVYYPYIDQVLLLEDIQSSEDENLFLGFFLRDMLETERIHYRFEEWNGVAVMVIELPVPGGSKYRSTQILIVDRKGLRPLVLEMYDINGAVNARMEFSDFQFNPELDSDFFNSDKIETSMLYEGWDASGMFFGSLEEAREHLDFLPLELDTVPEGFTRDVIQVVETDCQKVFVEIYSCEGERLTLLQKTADKGGGESLTSGELIYLDGKPAFYSERRDTRKISWTEGSIRVELVSSLARGSLTEIARSIK